MGRVAPAAVMGIVRGILTKGVFFVHVVVACFAFFFIPLGRWGEKLNPDPKGLVLPIGLGTSFVLIPLALVEVARITETVPALMRPLAPTPWRSASVQFAASA